MTGCRGYHTAEEQRREKLVALLYPTILLSNPRKKTDIRKKRALSLSLSSLKKKCLLCEKRALNSQIARTKSSRSPFQGHRRPATCCVPNDDEEEAIGLAHKVITVTASFFYGCQRMTKFFTAVLA
eukprot:scaffold6856_cov156-Amphora_coffeaeformis.AAC.1